MTLTGAYEHGRHRPWHEPTQAQKEAGNYRKPTLTLYFDLHIAIENPVGSVRHGIDPNGESWQTRMVYPYGYILGSRGVDGDGVDCYVGSNPEAPMVYVIHQRKAGDWSAYDEDKAMLCFDSQADAERAYLLHYNDERFLGPITIMPVEKFKSKVFASNGEMIKSYKGHAGRHGQRGGSLPKSSHDVEGNYSLYLPDSGSIKTVSEARRYFDEHIAGKWSLTIKRKAGLFNARVTFNDNKDHAYTKKNKATEKRELDLKRARLMRNLIGVIVAPDIVLENGGNDIYAEKSVGGISYAVVLMWSASAKEYRFRSVHYWDKAEYEKNRRSYGLAKPKGERATQNKTPVRLTKSSGASPSFTNLSDASRFDLLDRLGGEPYGTGISPVVSPMADVILLSDQWSVVYSSDDTPDLPTGADRIMDDNNGFVKAISPIIDISGLSCGCADHTLEVLSKAISEDGPDIWSAHENPFITRLIELFTERGLLRTDKVKTEFSAWMAGDHYEHRLNMVPRPGMMPYWTKPELGLVKTYLENIHPSLYTLEDWDYLISYLIQRYLPVDELMTDAEWLVSRSYLLGKAQAHLGTITPLVADTLMTALPLTIAQAGITFRLADAEQQILSYGKLHACEAVVSMTDVARHSLKRVVLDHMAKVASGDQAVTTGQLQQQLFDNFASMNRDWRRIATTEATELSGQGVIASLPAGAKVRRMEMYHGACGFCKKIDGMIFNVVDPAKPDKDDWADMWVGKNNIGRSGSPRKRTENGLELRQPHELWIPVPGANHPHCRGQLIPLNNGEAVTDDFSRWFYEMVSK